MGQSLWSDDAGPIKDVWKDLPVVDVAGFEIGRVELVKMGDHDAATAEGQQSRSDGILGGLVRLFGGGEPDTSKQLAEHLLRVGFVKVDAKGLLERDVYVAATRSPLSSTVTSNCPSAGTTWRLKSNGARRDAGVRADLLDSGNPRSGGRRHQMVVGLGRAVDHRLGRSDCLRRLSLATRQRRPSVNAAPQPTDGRGQDHQGEAEGDRYAPRTPKYAVAALYPRDPMETQLPADTGIGRPSQGQSWSR